MAIGYIIGAVPLIVSVDDYPAVGDVEKDVSFDHGNKIGTLEVPAEEDVEVGVGYGEDGTEFEGTYLGLTGNNLTAVLEKSVTLIGVLTS